MDYRKCYIFFTLCSLFLLSCTNSKEKLFTDITIHTGIRFINSLKETPRQNILNYEYMYNGGGVSVGDVNNDGLTDIYFTGNQAGNKLYLNKGNLQFEDITDKAGAGGKKSWATGVTMADVNGDGLIDIYVCYSGVGDLESRANLLYINEGLKNGVPSFAEKAAEYGINAPGSNSTQAAFFDYDRDGDLDMFLVNHATMFYSTFVNTTRLRTKKHPYFSNRLYRNDNGHFIDVSEQAGIKGGGNNFGLGISISDINNDGWPDIYTTNDYDEQDFLYLNNRNGTFNDITKQSLGHTSKNSMGCDIADYNNDGLMDIVVLDMLPEDNKRQKLLKGADEYDKYNLLVDSGYFHQNMRNTLQLNQGFTKEGVPIFSEIGQLAGISNTDWSWSPLFADFDNDGNKDLLVTNGFLRDFTNLDFLNFTMATYRKKYGAKMPGDQLIKELPSTKISNYIFHNNNNLTFSNVTEAWGLSKKAISNGATYADLDNDGDLDLIINNLGEQATVYRNNTEKDSGNSYLSIQLQDTGLNRFGIGAKVVVETVTGKKQFVEMSPARGFQSSVDPVLHFGFGIDSIIKQIIVYWPNGKASSYNNIKINSLLTLKPTSFTPATDTISNVIAATFSDITATAGINFAQHENVYVDFKQEYLLPWQLSRQGPRLAKADVNHDGLEDVFIGAPMGQVAQLYLQTINGKFILSLSQPWKVDSACEDIQSIFFDADGDGDNDLYVVSGGNEYHSDAAGLQDRLYLNDGKGNFLKAIKALPSISASKSCVAVADYNNDGRPDIFVGGRVVPGKYGITPESYLFKNQSQKDKVQFYNTISSDASELKFTGMVTDAVWNDINKDGWMDLIVTGEWMPVKIFINNKGKLEDKTTAYHLENTSGLWQRIIPGDIDGDGDTDFLLGNLAPNTQLRASVIEPMTLCVNDFMNNGISVPLLCYYIQGVSYPYASKDELIEMMPSLKKKFLLYETYATATLNDIFTPHQLKGMKELKVNTTKNSWLENKGNGKVELHELPVAAQFSCIQGGVFNKSLKADKPSIFAAGNFYPFRVQLGREDACKGLLLKYNNEISNFNVAGLSETGVVTGGDIRDMVAVKTKGDKLIIIISKNNDFVQVIKTN